MEFILLSSDGRPTADRFSLNRSSTCLRVSAVQDVLVVGLAPGLVDSWQRKRDRGNTVGTDMRPATSSFISVDNRKQIYGSDDKTFIYTHKWKN